MNTRIELSNVITSIEGGNASQWGRIIKGQSYRNQPGKSAYALNMLDAVVVHKSALSHPERSGPSSMNILASAHKFGSLIRQKVWPYLDPSDDAPNELLIDQENCKGTIARFDRRSELLRGDRIKLMDLDLDINAVLPFGLPIGMTYTHKWAYSDTVSWTYDFTDGHFLETRGGVSRIDNVTSICINSLLKGLGYPTNVDGLYSITISILEDQAVQPLILSQSGGRRTIAYGIKPMVLAPNSTCGFVVRDTPFSGKVKVSVDLIVDNLNLYNISAWEEDNSGVTCRDGVSLFLDDNQEAPFNAFANVMMWESNAYAWKTGNVMLQRGYCVTSPHYLVHTTADSTWVSQWHKWMPDYQSMKLDPYGGNEAFIILSQITNISVSLPIVLRGHSVIGGQTGAASPASGFFKWVARNGLPSPRCYPLSYGGYPAAQFIGLVGSPFYATDLGSDDAPMDPGYVMFPYQGKEVVSRWLGEYTMRTESAAMAAMGELSDAAIYYNSADQLSHDASMQLRAYPLPNTDPTQYTITEKPGLFIID